MKTTNMASPKNPVSGIPTSEQMGYEIWSRGTGKKLLPNSLGTDSEKNFRGSDTEKPMSQRWPVLGSPKISVMRSEFLKGLHKSQKYLSRFNKPATLEQALSRKTLHVKFSNQDTELETRKNAQKELLKSAQKIITPCGEKLVAVYKKGKTWYPISGHYIPSVPEGDEKMHILKNPAAESAFYILESEGKVYSASYKSVTSRDYFYFAPDRWDLTEEKDIYSDLSRYLQGNFRTVELSKEILGLCKSAKEGANLEIEDTTASLKFCGVAEFSETLENTIGTKICFSAKYVGKINRTKWLIPLDVPQGTLRPAKSENEDGSWAILMPCSP